MDIEKTMQFILDMQAKHEAWLQEHKEALKKHDEAFARIDAAIEADTARISQLVDVTLSLANHAEETDRIIRELAEETDRRIRELAEETSYKLNALIDTVDKLVKRNGRRE